MFEAIFVSSRCCLCFQAPVACYTAASPTEVTACLAAVRKQLQAGFFAAGFLTYEAAPAFDHAFATRPPADGLPAVWFGIYRAPRRRDWTWPDGVFQTGIWRALISRADYLAGVRDIRRRIAAGEIYQANYTFPLETEFRGDPQIFFKRLYQQQPADYCVWLRLPDWQILSLSPELLFRQKNGLVTVRPMKGTRPRAAAPAEDRALAHALQRNPKERAENIMIVDVLRNDLSRVCSPGSVKTRLLCAIEAYPTVWQMTSTIVGQTNADSLTTLAALFPSGSVTGAPKAQAMRVIRKLERQPRGIYCGSIGWIAPDGNAEFNVAIRTILADITTGRLRYHVGSGITYHARPEAEHRECLDKATLLRRVGGVIGRAAPV